MTHQLTLGDALLVVDMQNDFMAGGSLAVPAAEQIIDPVNDCIGAFLGAGLPIFASRDYHPADHLSFTGEGGPWPPHCVAGSWGAEFNGDLILPAGATVISKATARDVEAYSAMDGTELPALLARQGIRRVFVCGLATDYCVLASARDLLTAGYAVVVLRDGVKAVDVQPGDGDKALAELTRLGAHLISWKE